MAQYMPARDRFLRDHPRCAFPGCTVHSKDLHHSRGRVGRFLMLEEFWIALCRKHHDWVQGHPAEARKLNLLGPWLSDLDTKVIDV